MKKTPIVICLVLAGAGAFLLYRNHILQQVIKRLRQDSRVAEVLVIRQDPAAGPVTTIKFLEYDTLGKPLPARYFTLNGDLIQFQALVIRFSDATVMAGVPFKDKSIAVFTKVFVLGDSGSETQVFEINKAYEVPSGYMIGARQTFFERILWRRFWEYALNPEAARRAGIKNAQVEAPGTRFVPGALYTVKIEHDGGLRIDSVPLPAVLKGEKLEF